MADIVIEAPGVSAASLLAELHGQCFVQAWPETEMAQLLGSPGASAFIAIKASLPTGFLIARQAADEGRADHAVMAGDPDAAAGEREVGHQTPRLIRWNRPSCGSSCSP